MLRSFNAMIARVVEVGLWVGFAALIATVGLQVLARTVLKIPMIWTPDVAQILFSWLIFLGAAIALRRDAHYRVDMLPVGSPRLDLVLAAFGLVVSVGVIYLMVFNGYLLTQLRMSGTIQSLGISRLWMFVPIPISGCLMALFTLESLIGTVTGRAGR